MKVDVLLGLQWGDEAKGKIVDLLGDQHSVVARYNGGANAGHTVVVGKGSAYDLYLSRELKAAELVRSPTSPEVVSFFLEHGHDVAAGVKPQLEAELPKHPNLRMLPGHFMVISQAMGVPKNRGPVAQAFLTQFVEDMKASGFVEAALKRHGIQGAAVAPAAPSAPATPTTR